MTSGEIAILDYITKKNAEYTKININICLTDMVISQAVKKICNKLLELRSIINKMIRKELGAFDIDGRTVFCDTINNLYREAEYLTCSQGAWCVYPLRGSGPVITYEELYNNIGTSKDVSKKCIDRLLKMGKITRKKTIGGYSYCVDNNLIINQIISNPGKFELLHYNPMTYEGYVKSERAMQYARAADLSDEDMQKMYEKIISECA